MPNKYSELTEEQMQKVLDEVAVSAKNKAEKAHDLLVADLKATHEVENEAKDKKIADLTEKALKYDEAKTALDASEAKNRQYEAEAAALQLNNTLKDQGFKSERFDDAIKLLGDDVSEDAIKALAERMTEWLEPQQGAGDPAPEPPIIGVGGNIKKTDTDMTKEKLIALGYAKMREFQEENPEEYARIMDKD